MAVRLLLEPQAMPIVVARATDVTSKKCGACLTGGDSADTYADFEVWDLALHRCIMEASHNPLLLRLTPASKRPGTASSGATSSGAMIPPNDARNTNANTVRSWRRCIPGTGEVAVEAMQAHLADVRRNLLGSNT